jgi:hypothetical protein
MDFFVHLVVIQPVMKFLCKAKCEHSVNPLTPEIIPLRNAACRDYLLGILIFKRLTVRRPYKSLGVKGLNILHYQIPLHNAACRDFLQGF